MKRAINHQLRTTLIAGVALLALFIAGAALAQGPGQGSGQGACRGMGPGKAECVQGDFGGRAQMRLERMAARLDLTEEQTAAIAKIHEEGRDKNLEIRKQMMRLRNELQGEMLKDAPSQKKVLELNEKMGALRTQKHAIRLQNRLAVREQLTPEQRDRMMISDLGKGGRGGRSGHGGSHQGPRGSACGKAGGFGLGGGSGEGCGPRLGGVDCPNNNR